MDTRDDWAKRPLAERVTAYLADNEDYRKTEDYALDLPDTPAPAERDERVPAPAQDVGPGRTQFLLHCATGNEVAGENWTMVMEVPSSMAVADVRKRIDAEQHCYRVEMVIRALRAAGEGK